MQDLSFDFHDPIFEFNGLRFTVQVFTHENVYGLAEGATVESAAGHFRLRCDGLTWAGGQERAPGWVTVEAAAQENASALDTGTAGGVRFSIQAGAPETIRCVKLTILGCPMGRVAGLRENPSLEVPPGGLILKYPDGWRSLYMPLVALETAHGFLVFRSLDGEVREKRFTLLPRGDGMDVELIFEEAAACQDTRISVPDWQVGFWPSLEAVLEDQFERARQSYGLEPWETRADVPGWMREVALVAAIHCQHWTGYIFNDYAAALDKLRWLAGRFDPRRTLVYLPGWEGRYYYRYGVYGPDPRMGGEDGFAALCREGAEMGFHLMPMFGMNCVSVAVEGYQYWGAPSARVTGGGALHLGGSVDWDGSRHHDHAWGVLVNPGAPAWQNRLVRQITDLADRFAFEGVFLDISAGWWNDPKFDVYAGTLEVIRRIREDRPNLLVAGEGWYDAMGAATPLVQSGHTDGAMHYHDAVSPRIFDRTCRSFAHLCLGDPGRGSSGVHELGINPIRRAPVTLANIPTLTIVEDTMEQAPQAVMDILSDAEEYTRRYLR